MRTLLAGIFMASASAVAGAHDDPLKAFYDNTWEYLEVGEQAPTPIYINENGTFSMLLEEGKVLDGTWKLVGTKVCFMAHHEACFSDVLGRKLGETWSGVKDVDNVKYTGVVRAGRKASGQAAPHTNH